MCRTGNQSISKQCFQELLRRTGRVSLSNQEARRLLAAAGGCLNGAKPQEKREKVG